MRLAHSSKTSGWNSLGHFLLKHKKSIKITDMSWTLFFKYYFFLLAFRNFYEYFFMCSLVLGDWLDPVLIGLQRLIYVACFDIRLRLNSLPFLQLKSETRSKFTTLNWNDCTSNAFGNYRCKIYDSETQNKHFVFTI